VIQGASSGVFEMKNPEVYRWKAIQNLSMIVVMGVWVVEMDEGNAKTSRYHHCGR
jgi:hypothetical protein